MKLIGLVLLLSNACLCFNYTICANYYGTVALLSDPYQTSIIKGIDVRIGSEQRAQLTIYDREPIKLRCS